jgi:hypothetical protein
MRPARVRLIDLGFDGAFDTSMSFAQSLIQSIGARTNGNPIAEIEFIRTRDPVTVRTALQADATVVHIMAHGTTDPDGLGFWSEDEKTGLTLTELAEAFADDGVGIGADVVYADCSTAQGRFVRAIRDCIATDRLHRRPADGRLARGDDVRVRLLRLAVQGPGEGTHAGRARRARRRASDQGLRGHRGRPLPVRGEGAHAQPAGSEGARLVSCPS